MNKKGNFLFLICLFFVFVSCNNEKKQINSEETSNQQMYENSIFSLLIPDGYIYDESLEANGVNKLCIYRDSLEDFRTTIIWEVPGSFPKRVSDFVYLFTAKEIEEYESKKIFYDVMQVDSTYTIDNTPTYTTVSIFQEGNDTIIQSRTGMIIPNKFDMMILQRVNTKQSSKDVEIQSHILQTIKLK